MSVIRTAPDGTNPPDRALDTVMMSGLRFQCSKQKNFPVLPSPVCTSSSTKRVPCDRQSSCASLQYSGGAMYTPFPWMGSMMKAATSWFFSAR